MFAFRTIELNEGGFGTADYRFVVFGGDYKDISGNDARESKGEGKHRFWSDNFL
jgi:hypothetical protein